MTWEKRWAKYADCQMCGAIAGAPCKDLRWYWKYPNGYRWCNQPHARRRKL